MQHVPDFGLLTDMIKSICEDSFLFLEHFWKVFKQKKKNFLEMYQEIVLLL